MSKDTFLSGLVTLTLLLSIVLTLAAIDQGGTATVGAQSRTTLGQSTASLQHFSLSEMVSGAGKIFRGTVLDFQPGTVTVGGAEIPTVTYRFLVERTFKGTFTNKDGVQYTEVTMLGNIKKDVRQGSLQKLSVLPTPPVLQAGSDYLLLLTPESAVGLSTPIGLGQGSFEIFQLDKQEWAKNEFDNAGLFDGPVLYETLAARIQQGGN